MTQDYQSLLIDLLDAQAGIPRLAARAVVAVATLQRIQWKLLDGQARLVAMRPAAGPRECCQRCTCARCRHELAACICAQWDAIDRDLALYKHLLETFQYYCVDEGCPHFGTIHRR